MVSSQTLQNSPQQAKAKSEEDDAEKNIDVGGRKSAS
jgi:hypothetical protein